MNIQCIWDMVFLNWFYPKSGSLQIDRCVTYNYQENCWTTSSLDRTTYQDQGVFNLPYATDYETTSTPVFDEISGITNKYGASIYYAHEIGTDQVNSSGTTAIAAFIRSGDFDIDDGELFMSMRRFMPDYKFLVGNSVFFASLKLRTALPTYPPPTPTKNPKPVAVNAIVPVLTGSNVSLNPNSFSTV